ncbi:MAG: tRNA (adenine(22)-N(1))-methyltransferase TrmK, partial [Lachnospiraceae bacterium]|nr:tRNA (adenine(22)-N(1))-methyltransferase TrmK [Lachnospiraceae bacterium]
TGHIQCGLEYNGRDAAAKATELFSAVEVSENDSISYSGSDGQAAMSDLQLEFGPKLLEMRHPVLREYLLREQKTQERILESLRKGKSEMAEAREQEVYVKMQLIEEALRLYE